MKATVKFNSLFVASKFNVETLKKVTKFRPDALVLYKGEGKDKVPVCAMMVDSKDDISKNGVVFANDSVTGENVAVLSRPVPADLKTPDAIKAWVRDYLGLTIVNCEKIEAQIDAAMESIAADEAAMNAAINIDDEVEPEHTADAE